MSQEHNEIEAINHSFHERFSSVHEWAVARGFVEEPEPEQEAPYSQAKKIGWQERAKILQRSYKFTPTTTEELNAAFFRKIAFEKTVAGTAKHLQEVFLHQASNPELEEVDSVKAVRSVVHEIGAYYSDARDRRLFLLDTYDKMMQPINPGLHIAEVVDDEELCLGGVLSVIQFQAIRIGIQKGDRKPLIGGVKETPSGRRLVTGYDVETNDTVTLRHHLENLPDKDASVGGFRKNLLDAGRSHRRRMDMWHAALEESRAHLAVRDIAETYLPDAA